MVVKKAQCKYCKTKLICGKGTSHLLNHARKVCKGRHIRLGVKGQSKLMVKTEADGSTVLEFKDTIKWKFDQEFLRKLLVRAVVIHECPLCMVDHIGFRDFVESICPNFKMISRNTLKSDIMKLFNTEKSTLKAMLEHNDSRVAITTDMWTASNQKKGYMAVTSHFIDKQWVLRNRTLRFCFVPCPHTKAVLAKIVMDCLSQFSLENKISYVVVDNCTTNDAMLEILLEKLESRYLMLNGTFLHMRCSAHILNLVVKDGLDVIDPAIEKVRDCIVYWLATPKRIEKFEEACRLVNFSQPRRLVLDCKTRWNSTFLMLKTALPFKDVFSKLKRLNKRINLVVPSENDWLMAIVCEKLEIFHKATLVFSGRNKPTSNLFFRKVCGIRLAMRRWLDSDVETIRIMAQNMVKKFDKYWSNINGILAIATVLDPRSKLDCVEYHFKKLYGDESDNEVGKVRINLESLVIEYQKRDAVNKSEETSKNVGKRMKSDSYDSEDDDYAQYKKTKKRKIDEKGEVALYLSDDPIAENSDFDLLNWWKMDQSYPTLKKIAKDILAIPVSSVASESAFSMGVRVINPHRSRLHSTTVEALMCLQNWMTDDMKGTLISPHGYSVVTEDSEQDGEVIDNLDMDVDDVESETMEE